MNRCIDILMCRAPSAKNGTKFSHVGFGTGTLLPCVLTMVQLARDILGRRNAEHQSIS